MILRHTLTTKSLVVAGTIGAVALLAAWGQDELPKAQAGPPPPEQGDLRDGIGLASGANHYFRASGDCYGFHGPDNFGPVFAHRTAGGQDVNAGDNWRSTTLGHSAPHPP
ncbi:MAG TPA: hypothetical protein PK760_06650, partial [Flavobacteriales bacterium]|nr:hypothetical protein [Flavobacteriales bacterium]